MAFISQISRYVGQPQYALHKSIPYSPSNVSTTSSTSSTAFSVDAPSSQSSVSCSSVDDWSSSAYQRDTEGANGYGLQPLRRQDSNSSEEDVNSSCSTNFTPNSQSTGAADPSARRHPRRTQRLNSSELCDGKQATNHPLAPPPLVRQSERKDNFVESLVDTSTQMIEAIWPLSVSSCGEDTTASSAKRQQLLNLRTFVQEVLKRSKTSYSTLQVALYYLILIQSCIPSHDFTMEQLEDTAAYRALQCGRRMFLAALILASKYLQDRNFSTRAWGKISGLRTGEINSNEGAFLKAIDWKLHVPKGVFVKWENIVMNYSPAARARGHARSQATTPYSWKSLVRSLTPKLDGDFPIDMDDDSGYGSGSAGSDSGSDTELEADSFGTRRLMDMAPPPLPCADDLDVCSGSNEPTPTNSLAVPNATSKAMDATWDAPQSVPQVPRMSFLPTPQLTPQTRNFSTPAVNANSMCFKKPFVPSMACAMAHIKARELAKYNDSSCEWRSPKVQQSCPISARRSSIARSISSISSSDSIADRSSRTSRSSSISSNASSNCALPQPRLAVEASRRCANMQLCGLREESSQSTPTQADGKHVSDMPWLEQNKANYPGYEIPGTTDLDQIMNNGFRAHAATPVIYQPTMGDNTPGGALTQEAAAALSEMALNRQQTTPPSSQSSPIPRPTSARSLKRSRPVSVDLSVPSLHSLVRQQLSENDEDDSTVSSDGPVADSFVLRKEDQHSKRWRAQAPLRTLNPSKQLKSSGPREGPQRKRACAGSNRGARAEARMYERSFSAAKEPAMWDELVN